MEQEPIMEIESTRPVSDRKFADELPESQNWPNPSKEPILISSFAHKGGVGKTTGVQNIGCVLAKELGLRVLIIDADPQCSLTGALMRKYFVEQGRLERTKRETQENSQGSNPESDQESEQGIKQEFIPENVKQESSYEERIRLEERRRLEEEKQLEEKKKREEKKRLENKEARDDMDADSGEDIFYKRPSDEIVTVYRCFAPPEGTTFSRFVNETNIKERIKKVKLQHLKDYENLFFLPGDLDLNEFEDELFTAFTHGKQEHTNFPYADYPGLFCKVFREIAKERQIDVVLLDLSPGTTVLNRCLVMGSDYFLISSLPDFYSRRAINTVSKVISRWDKHINYFRDVNNTSPMFTMPPGPKFLGHLFNRVKLLKGKPPGDKEMKMKLIETLIDQNLLKLSNIVSDTFEQYLSPVIKEFDRAADRGIEKGVPMAFILSDDIKHSKNEKPWFDRQQKYYLGSYYAAIMTIFSNLSKEHHQRLGNRFNSRKNLEIKSEVKPEDRFKVHDPHRNLDMEFSVERRTSPSWVSLKDDYANHLQNTHMNEKYGYSLNKDVEDNMKILSNSTMKGYKELQETLKENQVSLSERLEKFENAIQGLKRGRDQLADLDKLVLISQLSAPRMQKDDEVAVNYIQKHREMTQQFINLQDFLKRDDVVEDFIQNLFKKEASLSSDQYELIVESMPQEEKKILYLWEHPHPQNDDITRDNIPLRLLQGKPGDKDHIIINLLKLPDKNLKLLKKNAERKADGKDWPEKRIKPNLGS